MTSEKVLILKEYPNIGKHAIYGHTTSTLENGLI